MATDPIPSPESSPKPGIIVIKRKSGGHGGHHGGAWKVAYADFVTAMMALFIVLWLMSADEAVKQAITFYFNNPSGDGTRIGTAVAGAGHSIDLPKEDMSQLREKIQEALKAMPNFRDLKDHVEMTITTDGLRIELLETDAGMFFDSGKPVPNESGANLLTRLADELGKLPNSIMIEGHTDAAPYAAENYSNWELSTDRANSARKLMQAHGLRAEQVAQVRGFADRQLRHPEDPGSASNRRISVIVQYMPTDPQNGAEKALPTSAATAKNGAAGGAEAAGQTKPAAPPGGTTPQAHPFAPGKGNIPAQATAPAPATPPGGSGPPAAAHK